LWLQRSQPVGEPARPQPSNRFVVTLALGVGVVGGIYGIGGGSLLSPILVGRGMPVARVAPAALVSTLVTSIVGAVTYVALAVIAPGHDIAPDWTIGIAAGVGGLVGGYLGAHLQPALPDAVLRRLLGTLAIAPPLRCTGLRVWCSEPLALVRRCRVNLLSTNRFRDMPSASRCVWLAPPSDKIGHMTTAASDRSTTQSPTPPPPVDPRSRSMESWRAARGARQPGRD
jgi:hypothetical protein